VAFSGATIRLFDLLNLKSLIQKLLHTLKILPDNFETTALYALGKKEVLLLYITFSSDGRGNLQGLTSKDVRNGLSLLDILGFPFAGLSSH